MRFRAAPPTRVAPTRVAPACARRITRRARLKLTPGRPNTTRKNLHVARYALVDPDPVAVCKARIYRPPASRGEKTTPPTIHRLSHGAAKPDTPEVPV